MMLSALLAASGLFAGLEQHEMLMFQREKIGNVTYEAASAFDVNNDGAQDIVSGEYWFPGPDFSQSHKIGTIRQEGDYYDDFSDYPMDVNGDGYLDIVAGGWFGMTFQWRENPKGQPVEWTTHDVLKTGNIERNCFYDIDGDGVVEAFATTKPVHFFRLKRDAAGKGTGEWDHFQIDNGGGGHGFGAGDVNGDGRMDLLFDSGWMAGPADPYAVAEYTWHPIFKFGTGSVPILVHDVNGDGKNDIIVGQGHDYGLSWWEQTGDPTVAEGWTEHKIEQHRSQFHEMQLVDMDNDGEVELVTGKRYRAHAFADPGSLDPLGLYYYKIDGGKFRRGTIDYGPAGEASGSGIYLWLEDIDGNGWRDVVAPGKEGLYLFRNYGPLSGTPALAKESAQ
jgi:hypothetical protein